MLLNLIELEALLCFGWNRLFEGNLSACWLIHYVPLCSRSVINVELGPCKFTPENLKPSKSWMMDIFLTPTFQKTILPSTDKAYFLKLKSKCKSQSLRHLGVAVYITPVFHLQIKTSNLLLINDNCVVRLLNIVVEVHVWNT